MVINQSIKMFFPAMNRFNTKVLTKQGKCENVLRLIKYLTL